MSKKKRTKKYGGRTTMINPLTMFGGMLNHHGGYLVDLQGATHAAMSSLVRGVGDKSAWDKLVGMNNVGKILAQRGIGREFLDDFARSGDALMEMGIRSVETGRFVFKGDELRLLQETMACHDAQLENIRMIDVELAIREVDRRLLVGQDNVSVNKEMAVRETMRKAI
jgi:hypothetical protein